jgi:hypothetical protein
VVRVGYEIQKVHRQNLFCLHTVVAHSRAIRVPTTIASSPVCDEPTYNAHKWSMTRTHAAAHARTSGLRRRHRLTRPRCGLGPRPDFGHPLSKLSIPMNQGVALDPTAAFGGASWRPPGSWPQLRSESRSRPLPMNRRDALHESLTRRRIQLLVPKLKSGTRIARPSRVPRRAKHGSWPRLTSELRRCALSMNRCVARTRVRTNRRSSSAALPATLRGWAALLLRPFRLTKDLRCECGPLRAGASAQAGSGTSRTPPGVRPSSAAATPRAEPCAGARPSLMSQGRRLPAEASAQADGNPPHRDPARPHALANG